MDTPGNEFKFVLNNESGLHIKNLKELCRYSILNNVCSSLKQIWRVKKLPLPAIVKDYVTTFCISGDFDMSGTFMDYHFNFPYHSHHKMHQIYPAVHNRDGSKVLMQVIRDWPDKLSAFGSFGSCAMCGHEGVRSRMQTLVDIERWRTLEHRNLMNCLVSFVNSAEKIKCFVLEFPVMNIQTFVFQLFLCGQQFPEYLAWETLVKLTSVFLYLETMGVNAWDFCLPEHIVIDHNGEIKLENMLLYLPNPGQGIVYPPQIASKFLAPELLSSREALPETVVWGIGNIIRELIASIPTVIKHGNLKQAIPAKIKGSLNYSKDLKSVITNCTINDPKQRPSLSKLNFIAKRYLSVYKPTVSHEGYTNFLQFLEANA